MLPNKPNYESDKRDLVRLLVYQMWSLPAYRLLLNMFAEEINRDIIYETTVPREHAEQIASDSTQTIKKVLRYIAKEIARYAELVQDMDFSDEERKEIERRTQDNE